MTTKSKTKIKLERWWLYGPKDGGEPTRIRGEIDCKIEVKNWHTLQCESEDYIFELGDQVYFMSDSAQPNEEIEGSKD